jgi:multisubunit Na+/H+ antiporter MnhG subunit
LVVGFGLFAGVVLLVPWLVGTLILAILVWLTNPPRA